MTDFRGRHFLSTLDYTSAELRELVERARALKAVGGAGRPLDGRVLAGIQVPPAERAEFIGHLDELHYGYVEETDNPAYRMFLGG